MGNERAAHLNAFQKAQLGWLGYGSSPSITTVETDGAYSLEPYELGTAGPKALKILKGIDAVTGAKSWYHVEYRQALGFDSFLTGNTNVLNGVVIHTGSDSDRKSSLILDTTPQSATYGWYDWEDPALGEGLSLSDPDTGVTITTAWTDGGGASVTVDLGAQACVHANPTVSLSPSESQWVAPGTPVSYTVTVTNNDNSACSPVLFALSASVPSSWTAAFAAPTLSLDSGSSASTTLTVTSPTTATGGFYAVGVTATNSANTIYSAATSATYVVVSALDVTVSTNKTSYTRNQSVSITARVSSGASPVANASITFTVTKPNGAVVKQTATTDASGAGIFTLRLKQQDPVGTYQVRVDATSNTLSGNATASFTVQ